MPSIIGGSGKTDIVSNPDRELGKIVTIPGDLLFEKDRTFIVGLSPVFTQMRNVSKILTADLRGYRSFPQGLLTIAPVSSDYYLVETFDEILYDDSNPKLSRNLSEKDETIYVATANDWELLYQLDLGAEYVIKAFYYQFGVKSSGGTNTAYGKLELESATGSKYEVITLNNNTTNWNLKTDYVYPDFATRYINIQGYKTSTNPDLVGHLKLTKMVIFLG